MAGDAPLRRLAAAYVGPQKFAQAGLVGRTRQSTLRQDEERSIGGTAYAEPEDECAAALLDVADPGPPPPALEVLLPARQAPVVGHVLDQILEQRVVLPSQLERSPWRSAEQQQEHAADGDEEATRLFRRPGREQKQADDEKGRGDGQRLRLRSASSERPAGAPALAGPPAAAVRRGVIACEVLCSIWRERRAYPSSEVVTGASGREQHLGKHRRAGRRR